MATEGLLKDSVVIVTGAARGLGLETARRVGSEGATLAIWDLDSTLLSEAERELAVDGISAHAQTVDVSDSRSVEAAVARVRTELGPVTGLVNNAGIAGAADPLETDDEEWHRYLDVNATGTFYCIRACLPDMIERRYGKIVNIGSLSAQQGRPSVSPAYAASKGAVLGLTVNLAANLGEYGITVNAVNPGFIRTEIHDAFSDEQIARLTADIPLHRRGRRGEHGTKSDIAGSVLFLLSADSDYLSGAFLNVNGASRTG